MCTAGPCSRGLFQHDFLHNHEEVDRQVFCNLVVLHAIPALPQYLLFVEKGSAEKLRQSAASMSTPGDYRYPRAPRAPRAHPPSSTSFRTCASWLQGFWRLRRAWTSQICFECAVTLPRQASACSIMGSKSCSSSYTRNQAPETSRNFPC